LYYREKDEALFNMASTKIPKKKGLHEFVAEKTGRRDDDGPQKSSKRSEIVAALSGNIFLAIAPSSFDIAGAAAVVNDRNFQWRVCARTSLCTVSDICSVLCWCCSGAI